jgi:hypothetical protein
MLQPLQMVPLLIPQPIPLPILLLRILLLTPPLLVSSWLKLCRPPKRHRMPIDLGTRNLFGGSSSGFWLMLPFVRIFALRVSRCVLLSITVIIPSVQIEQSLESSTTNTPTN